MTESQELFLVLIAIYLLECLASLRHGSIAFRWRMLGRGTWGIPSRHLATPLSGLTWKSFNPCGTFVAADPFPVSISPDGVLSYVSDAAFLEHRTPQQQEFLTWKSIRSIKAIEKIVYVNDRPFVRATSEASARWIADFIGQTKSIPHEKRAESLKTGFAEAFNTQELGRRLDEFSRNSRLLRSLCLIQFVLIFPVGPLLVSYFDWTRVWLELLLLVIAVNLGIAFATYWVHCAIRTKWTESPWIGIVAHLLNPVGSTRACDQLTRELLFEFHPVAIAHVVCPEESLQTLARSILCDLTHPMLPVCPCEDAAAKSIEAWYRLQRLDTLKQFLVNIGLDPTQITRPAPKSDAGVQSYCPRCLQNYEQAEGICSTCGGISLVQFEST